MARVTVKDDCLEYVPNKYELIALAALRAHYLKSGSKQTVDEHHKFPTTSLKEIGSGNLDIEKLRQDLIDVHSESKNIETVDDENLHAELKEAIGDEAELSDEGSQFVDVNQVYTDNISEEDLDSKE